MAVKISALPDNVQALFAAAGIGRRFWGLKLSDEDPDLSTLLLEEAPGLPGRLNTLWTVGEPTRSYQRAWLIVRTLVLAGVPVQSYSLHRLERMVTEDPDLFYSLEASGAVLHIPGFYDVCTSADSNPLGRREYHAIKTLVYSRIDDELPTVLQMSGDAPEKWWPARLLGTLKDVGLRVNVK